MAEPALELIDQRLAKALSHPLRVRILAILNHRVASPIELSKELAAPLTNVSYHVKALAEHDCVELVKTRPRRGAVEHFYRGTQRAFLSDIDWGRLSPDAQGGISTAVVKMIVDSAVEALTGGTFDKREDRHLSWTPMVVDEEGWDELTDILAEALDRAMDVQARSAARLAKRREVGISSNLSILHYESPSPEEKADGVEQSV